MLPKKVDPSVWFKTTYTPSVDGEYEVTYPNKPSFRYTYQDLVNMVTKHKPEEHEFYRFMQTLEIIYYKVYGKKYTIKTIGKVVNEKLNIQTQRSVRPNWMRYG